MADARRALGGFRPRRAAGPRVITAAPYSMRRTPEVVTLEDARHEIVASIAPSAGNIVFEMLVKGRNVLQFPYASLEAFKAKPGLAGIPFMGPWANRLDEQAFYAGGRKYAFDMELGNVRGAHPIHGFLSAASDWEVVEARADATSVWVTSRLEFFRHPLWMAQFPSRTRSRSPPPADGALQTRCFAQSTSRRCRSQLDSSLLHAVGRATDDRTIAVGARTEWLLAPDKIPTGETRPITGRFPDPKAAALKDHDLDHVFGDLVRDSSGRAVMSVTGKSQKLDVVFGPNYRAAVVYAPKGRDFICFEPMAGITDASPRATRPLQEFADPPGETWRESFWIRASGSDAHEPGLHHPTVVGRAHGATCRT